MLMRTRNATDHYAIHNDIFDDKPGKHDIEGPFNRNYDRNFPYSDVDIKRSRVCKDSKDSQTKTV